MTMNHKAAHTPLELALRYACQAAHRARQAVEFDNVTTLAPRRRNATQRISESVLARLRMESAEQAWADGLREAA